MCPGPSCLPVFVYAGLSPGRLSPPYLSSCISLSILPSHAIFSKSICPAPPGRIHISLLTPAHFLSLFGTLHFLDLGGYFLPRFREVFNYYLKHFLMPFLFVVFSRDTYDLNVGALNIVPEVSEDVLTSFYSLLFFPLCIIYSLLPLLFYYWFPPECFKSQLLHCSLLTNYSLFLLKMKSLSRV